MAELRYGTLDLFDALERMVSDTDTAHAERPSLTAVRVDGCTLDVTVRADDHQRVFRLKVDDVRDDAWEYGVEHPEVETTAHTSRGSAEFTLSKLPGGVLVKRLPGGEWEDAE